MRTYKNIKTGAVLVTNNVIVAEGWEEVKAPQPEKKTQRKKVVRNGKLSDSR